MIEIGTLTSRDIGRWVAWTDEDGAHRGELLTWGAGQLVVLLQPADPKQRSQRVTVAPAVARFSADWEING